MLSPDNLKVHGLWIGSELSALELLTLHSFIKHGHQFHLWIYEPIKTPLPEKVIIRDANQILDQQHIFSYQFKNTVGHGKGSLAGFSDIFRYKLLYEEGGWWTDMDMTCIKALDFCDAYVFRNHDLLPVVGNLMKCPSKSSLMKDCFERAFQEVKADNRNWLKPIQILNEEITKAQLSKYIQKDIVNPDRWAEVDYFRCFPFQKQKDYYCIHWMNEEWRSRKLNKNECIRFSLLDQLMQAYDIPVKRKYLNYYVPRLLKNRFLHFIIPLIPYPVRKPIKDVLRFFKNKLSSILVL